EGDLNFCAMYESPQQLSERLLMFIETSLFNVQKLPDSTFHRLVVKGLVSLYLSDKKTDTLTNGAQIKKECLQQVGGAGRIFYWNTKLYYALYKSSYTSTMIRYYNNYLRCTAIMKGGLFF